MQNHEKTLKLTTHTPQIRGGGVFTLQISGVGVQKYCKTSVFDNPPPQFRGQISPPNLGLGNLIERAQFFPVPALDKNRSPTFSLKFQHWEGAPNRRKPQIFANWSSWKLRTF